MRARALPVGDNAVQSRQATDEKAVALPNKMSGLMSESSVCMKLLKWEIKLSIVIGFVIKHANCCTIFKLLPKD